MKRKKIDKPEKIEISMRQYLASERSNIQRIFSRMHMHDFMVGLVRDCGVHGHLIKDIEQFKDDVIDMVFDGVEPEWRSVEDSKIWEKFNLKELVK
jgi:hypothetical protein